MYQFTKTNETPVASHASLLTEFGGVVLDWELTDGTGSFQTLNVTGRGVVSYSAEVYSTGETATLGARRLNPRIITVTYRLTDETNEGLRRRFERLNKLLAEKEQKLLFSDDDQFHYIATFTDAEEPDEKSNDIVSAISFLCPDPKKYKRPLTLQNVEKVQLQTLYSVYPVVFINLDNNSHEVVLENASTGKLIHLKSGEPFTAAHPIVIDTKEWTVNQEGQDRLGDLVITSDLEDFAVNNGDVLTLNVPGSLSLVVEGASL